MTLHAQKSSRAAVKHAHRIAATVADPAQLAELDASIPVGRLAEPEEIADPVAFLAGDGASSITATTIFADGGIMQSSPGL